MATRPSTATFCCPRCGSTRVRRSLPQDGWERFVHEVMPVHYYRCRECNFRDSHWGTIAWPDQEQPTELPTRPVEDRDLTAAAVQRRRVILLVLLAIGAGMVTGVIAHSCQPPPRATQESL